MQFEFSESETELVRRLLDREIRDLSYEIADTDNSRFRDELREHRDLVRSLLDRFGGPVADAES